MSPHKSDPAVFHLKDNLACLGTRSATGSDNISIFGSLTHTAALHGSRPLEMFRALFNSSAAAQDVIFCKTSEASLGS